MIVTTIEDFLRPIVTTVQDVQTGLVTIVETSANIVTEVMGNANIQIINADTGKSNSELKPVNFSYGDPSHVVFTVPANSVILKIAVNILNTFDGVGAQLKLGIASNQELILQGLQTDLSVATKFEIDPNINITSLTDIYIYITPGTSPTKGNGWITLEYAAIN